MNTVLEVCNLQKSYKNFGLQDVSFSLYEDCITGFIGINGSGKTTTIRSILGLAIKEGGTIKLFGEDMDKNPKEVKDRIGLVLDDGAFYEELTIAQMKGILAPAYTRWDEKVFKEYMERFTLDVRQPIVQLSKGMRLKFALAMALSHHAELLIMDEPTSGLDPLVRKEFIEIMQEFMLTGGKSVFFSTHITSDLDKVADTLIHIYKGKIVRVEDKDSLLERFRVVKGDAALLDDSLRQLFASLTVTDFGFTGVTEHVEQVQKALPKVVLERPTIEDIMLADIEGSKL